MRLGIGCPKYLMEQTHRLQPLWPRLSIRLRCISCKYAHRQRNFSRILDTTDVSKMFCMQHHQLNYYKSCKWRLNFSPACCYKLHLAPCKSDFNCVHLQEGTPTPSISSKAYNIKYFRTEGVDLKRRLLWWCHLSPPPHENNPMKTIFMCLTHSSQKPKTDNCFSFFGEIHRQKAQWVRVAESDIFSKIPVYQSVQ